MLENKKTMFGLLAVIVAAIAIVVWVGVGQVQRANQTRNALPTEPPSWFGQPAGQSGGTAPNAATAGR